MALKMTVETNFGETRELYVRINNLDQITNHDEAGPDMVRFRGYVSKEAFDARKAFVWELVLPVTIDVGKPAWKQAYDALKAHDPAAEIEIPFDPREALDAHAPKVLRDRAEDEWRINKADYDIRIGPAMALRDALRMAKDC